MVDYRYLKAFLAAANYLNFTRAAEELKISVSALSRQISLLEQSCSTE
ncbi:MAG: LysR family transcriptional regulator, partial [Methylotenera sp.]|nr:LysR family transcriptional regulator [Oligoflexia bacterium]